MKLYACTNCKNPLYFENDKCLVCSHPVGFDAEKLTMVTLEDTGEGTFRDIKNTEQLYRQCENAEHGTCNWLIPSDDHNRFCKACQLNRTIPVLAEQENLSRWKRIEVAKHRLVYALLRLRLPVMAKASLSEPAQAPENLTTLQPVSATADALLQPAPASPPAPVSNPPQTPIAAPAAFPPPAAPAAIAPASAGPAPATPDPASVPAAGAMDTPAEDPGIAFDFMANISPEERVMTGHNNGVITLNIEEADEAERARNKQDLGEKYRTLLGHFRHEIGHYYWDVLIKDGPLLEEYRKLFGDETKDYQEALKTYYEQSAPADWMEHYISPYASAHPWEDWAETWAHYMHMMDTLETAYAFGIGIHPGKQNELDADISRDPYNIRDFQKILKMWLPLTFAVNSLNRSMGHADFYPFVISPQVAEKLSFIHTAAGAGRN